LKKELMEDNNTHRQLAAFMAEQFSAIDSVQAVALSGSAAGGAASDHSDIDLYVFATEPIPVAQRQQIAAIRGYSRADFNLQYWDTGDEWFDAPSGIEVDIMYWSMGWLEEQLARVIDRHQSAIGYTTCFWHTVKQAVILFDRQGWFTALQEKAQATYPEALRSAIIQLNTPLLHAIIPSYTHQLEKAIQRNDMVSVNHRLCAYLASYFDVLFALNRLLHPGEKRLLAFAENNCPLLPEDMAADIRALTFPPSTDKKTWLAHLDHLNKAMDQLLTAQGYDPRTGALIRQ
jgi:hypothetical protein